MTKTATKQPADLSHLDSFMAAQNEGIDVPIKGPDGKSDLGFSIRVAGPDSDRQKQAVRDIQNKRLEEEDFRPARVEDGERNTLVVMAKSTISWSPVKIDGAELPCNEDNAIKLYTRYPFILEQVIGKAGGRKAFLDALSKPSDSTPASEEK